MSKIRVLSDILASQVAAGEVVDQGGAALIRVSDDGCGMSREDAMLSLERHATSKLKTSTDLSAIRTLGFRGEAVPSIASVSRFRMITREADAVVGTEIWVDGGRIREVRDAGCAPGTMIEAKALFYNMPARKKFLRAENTESAHIEHQLRMHALAAPWVRFRLRRDDKEMFDLPPANDALDRVRQLLGTELAGELVPLASVRRDGIQVEGFVLPANHARKGRRHQCVFLNGRPVEDPIISRALAEGFRGMLADGLHPAAWVWLEMEPMLVDVNVHPAKREVRFHRPAMVRDAITEAVMLGFRKPAPPTDEELPISPQLASTRSLGEFQKSMVYATQPTFGNLDSREQPEVASSSSVDRNGANLVEKPWASTPQPSKSPDFRVIGMLKQRFVILESEGGLVLFDPKAAKERIFYDQIQKTRHSEGLKLQKLLVPLLMELDPREVDVLLREGEVFLQVGLEIEPFGGNTVQICSLPACLGVSDPRIFIHGVLDEILHDSTSSPRFALDRIAKTVAKRAAMLLRPKLEEVEALLSELFDCDLPYCTAEGRPTLTEFGMRDLEKRLGIPS
jgi:DNA mismatch repair protein MutL